MARITFDDDVILSSPPPSLPLRFYGKSQPGLDLSMDYITLLNSRQALEDLASFRINMTKRYNMTDDNRWIAFGGSYPGALAAWLRMKYPNIIYGAVASSAPIQAMFDFYKYFEVVSASLEQARNGEGRERGEEMGGGRGRKREDVLTVC